MRSIGLAAGLLIAIGTGGVAVAATARPASPSVADCVAAWNASPGLKATHTTHRVLVLALKKNTFTATWSKTSSVAMAGPGCIVSVALTAGHGLLIEKRWSPTSTTPWRKPVAGIGLTSGEKLNATLGPDGRIALR